MAIIKFGHDDMKVKMSFDTGQRVEGEYGVQYKWSCNTDDIFYATEHMNALIHQLSPKVQPGDYLTIKKIKKQNKNGDTIDVFCINGKTLDDISNASSFVDKSTPSNTTAPNPTLNTKPSVEERLDRIEKELHITYTNAVESADAEMPF